MNTGADVGVSGNGGWGLGECMMDGRIEVHGQAGSGVAASIRGGMVYVAGDTAARAGIAMKGGALVVGGSVGYMSGFMMQRGTIVVCGSVASRGADAVIEEVTDEDRAMLKELLGPLDIDADAFDFTKILSGPKLWNFSTKEPELWKSAL